MPCYFEVHIPVKADRVNAVVFDLHQIKRLTFFGGHPVHIVAMYIQFAISFLMLVLSRKRNTRTKLTQILLLTGNDF